MLNEFKYGPLTRINIELVDDAKSIYGNYNCLPEMTKDDLQLLSHAVIQVTHSLLNSDHEVIWIDKTFMILHIDNIYSINNFGNGMAIMNMKKIDDYYEIDFFSIKQMNFIEPILSYAYHDMLTNGRQY